MRRRRLVFARNVVFVADPFGGIAHGPAFESRRSVHRLACGPQTWQGQTSRPDGSGPYEGPRHVLRAAASTTRASWHRIARSACMAASNPEPHTLLMVMAVTWSGHPAPKAICRAGFCPKPLAEQPIKASSTTEGSMPSKADWATLAKIGGCGVGESTQKAANWGADSGENYGFWTWLHSISGGIRRICGVEHPPNTPLTTSRPFRLHPPEKPGGTPTPRGVQLASLGHRLGWEGDRCQNSPGSFGSGLGHRGRQRPR